MRCESFTCFANLKRLDSLDAGGGASREVCSGRDGWDSWAWQIMKRTRAQEQSVHAHSNDWIAKSTPLLTRKILRLCVLLC